MEPKQVNMKKMSFNNKGFTLVEIMVSLVLISLVVAAIYGVYTIQQRTYTVQEQVTEMQQKIRAALDFMTRDMRMTNYNYDNNCQVGGILEATDTSFSAEYCHWNENTPGSNKWELRRIRYSLNPTADGSNNLMRNLTINPPGSGRTASIAEGVDALEFCYLGSNFIDDEGDVVCMTLPINDSNRGSIRAVRISLLMRSTHPDRRHTDTSLYLPASGNAANWWQASTPSSNPPNDGHHRRLLITTIQLRNMGLLQQ
jgi:type IV pilus assembly protein PilW